MKLNKIPPAKNELCEVTIEDFTKNGEGIGHVEGYTLFVKDAVIGDTVLAKITRPKKSYAFARVEKIPDPSPDRRTPLCEHAGRCGGCCFQDYDYEKQLEWKHRYVKSVMERIGCLPDLEVRPVLGMKDPLRYRNKAQYPVSEVKGRIVSGFYAGHTHSVIENDDCLIADPVFAEVMKRFLSYMRKCGVTAYDEKTHKGLVRHVLIRSGYRTGEVMVCPVINGEDLPRKEQLVETLSHVKGLKSICLNINKKPGNVILGEKTVPVYGSPWITDVLLGNTYRISPRSFYQVNPVQTEVLYEEVIRAAGLTGKETVFDLYCGIGTIALTLARHAGRVYGVEIVPDAVKDARENANINGITNAGFYVGAAEDLVAKGKFEDGVPCPHPDVVVLDPPRKGCDASLIRAVRAMEPDRIVYVSCDPATLARDLKLFGEPWPEGAAGGAGRPESSDIPEYPNQLPLPEKKGVVSYRAEYAQPVDMFPETAHVEIVCCLGKRKPDPYFSSTSFAEWN